MPHVCQFRHSGEPSSVWLEGGIGEAQAIPWRSLKRIHKQLFRINEKVAALEAEASQVEAELEYHRSINDDAQRDAAVGNYIDREEAGLTAADVRRFEKTLSALDRKKARLLDKRSQLLARLPE